ncbi:MAG TPA: DegT/DnrJ/EryC1/StrS family aminotransferase [Rugosibacter sp.]
MREIPPTAGLPLTWRDLFPARASLEQGLADFIHVLAVQITCSGTAAQIITLTTLKRHSTRRKVILPAYTCPLVALAILHCGLQPVLCDLQPDHFDLDHNRLAALCDTDTLAIIATHLGGRVADLSPVLDIARISGAYVIEDAAQSLGASWQGQPVGMAGDAGFYSLAVGKGLPLYEGGVLITRDASLRQQFQSTAAEIAPLKWQWELRRSLELLGYAALYQPWALSFDYGLPLRRALQQGHLIEAVGDDFSDDIPLHRVGRWRKAVGANALKRLPAFLDNLHQQAMPRLARLASIPGIKIMQDKAEGKGTWPFFMVLLPSQAARDAALETLWGAGLGVSRLYIHALPDYPYLSHRVGQAEVSNTVPNARDFSARMLTISNSLWLDENSFERIAREIEVASQLSG